MAGALLLLPLRQAAVVPTDPTLVGMLEKIRSGAVEIEPRHEVLSHVLLGAARDEKDASAACILGKADGIIKGNGVKGNVERLQVDLATCCRKDEKACVEDVEEAYGLLTRVRLGRLGDADAQDVAAHAAALLIGAARKRVGIARVRLPYARYLSSCEGPPAECTMQELRGVHSVRALGPRDHHVVEEL